MDVELAMTKRNRRDDGRAGRVSRWRALIVAVAILCLGAAAYLTGGFVRFAEEVASLKPPESVGAIDGIVVLTGGAHRIEQAVELLREGRGRRLLISGVNPDTGRRSLSRLTGGNADLFECCVDLDYAAQNTIGNAQMTATWAASHGLRRIILVTSDYHIPRSLIEMQSIENAPEIVPYPVHPELLWQANGHPSAIGLKLLATEYAKVLAAKARIALGVSTDRSLDREVAIHASAAR